MMPAQKGESCMRSTFTKSKCQVTKLSAQSSQDVNILLSWHETYHGYTLTKKKDQRHVRTVPGLGLLTYSQRSQFYSSQQLSSAAAQLRDCDLQRHSIPGVKAPIHGSRKLYSTGCK